MNSTLLKNSLALATNLVGTKYTNNGMTPNEGFDCWGLYWYFLTTLGFDIPNDYPHKGRTDTTSLVRMTSNARDDQNWKLLDTPVNLCLVAFGRTDAITHVGVWLDSEQRVLHATKEFGTVCEDLLAIKRNRNMKHKFYQWQPQST